MKRIYRDTLSANLESIKYGHEGFIACDDEKYHIWIKKLEELFKDIGIDTSKIIVYITIKDTIWFKSYRKNTAGKTAQSDDKFCIYIRNDLEINEFIMTYIHEHGHATQVLGYGNDDGNTLLKELTKIISESIACRFEENVLRKFNKKYKMNIPIQFINKYGKDFCFLITKKEFKIS